MPPARPGPPTFPCLPDRQDRTAPGRPPPPAPLLHGRRRPSLPIHSTSHPGGTWGRARVVGGPGRRRRLAGMTTERAGLGRWAPRAFFACHLVLGLLLFRDYGLSFDEPCQRYGCGVVNRRFLVHGRCRDLLDGSEKYHGPAFELVLIFAEKALGLTDLQRVYWMRHLLTFLVFHGACVVFYRVLRRRHRGRGVALLGAAFLVLTPRLFAESFYNCKDVVFLSANVFGLATLLRWQRAPTLANAAGHAVASAFLVAVRIPGVLVPALTLLAALAGAWRDRREGRPAARLRTLAAYFVLLAACTVLFWPVLMNGPV